ncbi:Neuropeptide capa receptor [Folsomia candida]|uniref:Neuropeptide capa receptor n=1 Tax=Folsomia candida TaxID=158441 RepID=A0A226EMR2_FOLCA|nr:Neuropeptide capa receptor [Folsomia candida]
MQASPESDRGNNNSTSVDIGTMIFFGDRSPNTTSVFAVTHSTLIDSENGDDSFSRESNSFDSLSNFPQVATSIATLFVEHEPGGGQLLQMNGSIDIGLNLGPMGDLVESANDTGDIAYVWPIRDPLYILIPITVIYVIILVLGLCGNIVTCIVIIRSRYLHTTTNYYLFSLAISDLLLLLAGLPAEMHSIWWRYPYVFGEVFCIGRGLAAETSSNATVLTITAFTVERYLAICRPFMIQKWQNKLSRVVRQILVIWVISVAFAIPQALQFGLDNIMVGPNQTAVTCGVKKVLIEHSFEIATFVFFVAPMILITGLYCMIGFTLRNASRVKESKLRLRKSLSGHKREVGQQRVLKMLGMSYNQFLEFLRITSIVCEMPSLDASCGYIYNGLSKLSHLDLDDYVDIYIWIILQELAKD